MNPPIRQSYVVGKGKLVPESLEAGAQLDSIPVGEKVDVVIYRDRGGLKFENLVYLTFGLIGEAMRWRARNVRGWLAVKTGRADVVHWPPEELKPKNHIVHPLLIPHGTGPSDMGRAQLEAFWEDAREVTRRDVLPYIEPAAAEQIEWRLKEDIR